MRKLTIAAASLMLLAGCAIPSTTVLYQTYYRPVSDGPDVYRYLDPIFFRTEAEADAYVERYNRRVNPYDPTGQRLFDIVPLEYEGE